MTFVIIHNPTTRVTTTTTKRNNNRKIKNTTEKTPNNYTRTTDNIRLDYNPVDRKSSSCWRCSKRQKA